MAQTQGPEFKFQYHPKKTQTISYLNLYDSILPFATRTELKGKNIVLFVS
jgi:hypothetical protein